MIQKGSVPNCTVFDKMYVVGLDLCIFMLKVVVFVSVLGDYAYQIELFS